MSQQFIAEVRMTGFNFAPIDWAKCDGQLMSIAQDTALFQLIGTIYGGDGVNTFALPNLKARLAVHQGAGPGSTWVVGQTQGSSTVTLTTPQVPSHTHQASFVDGVQFANETSAPGALSWPSRSDKGPVYTTTAPNAQLSPLTIASAGGSQPHENTMPILGVNYIIALFGIFPSQN